ncbi:ClpXP protease specificity-enhancing factor SspB [Sansalvadorimonas verongulae]|uniref:ClpXP protease specificity-enhancing factor SspB n=1 Tax=Sansalvadorimonas verongulae TaxID=2172824 RepID=UPI0012BD2E43|nr:ClpXP protease specificity-enhancing factor SspB [Sansalvadorimonas verongulae]MTI11925.1 hypothetical protein [Sansalvadorimonas verongulae]
MKPLKYFLVQTAINWITESGLTPYILVNLEKGQQSLPAGHTQAGGGQVALNVSALAVCNLEIDEQFIRFECRFSGQWFHSVTSMQDVMAVYAKEAEENRFVFEQASGALAFLSSTKWLGDGQRKKPALQLIN